MKHTKSRITGLAYNQTGRLIMQTFRIHDNQYRQRSYFYHNQFIQFQDHYAQVAPEVAYQISRIAKPAEGLSVPLQAPVPFNLDSWKKDKRLIWSCNIASASGFGSVTENVTLSLLKQGIRVVNPGVISTDVIHGGEFVDRAVEQSLNQVIIPDCLEIQYTQPPSLKTDVVQRIWTYAMWETDHTPRSWIKKLNQVERILVPSRWLIDSWRNQGVTVPISVFHHGVDPRIYSYLDRPINRTPYTFLQYGELDSRKGTDVLFKAFAEEFTGQADVRLILKTTRPGITCVPLHHPGITIINTSLYSQEEVQTILTRATEPVVLIICSPYSKQQIRNLLFDADCFIGVSRGEGFSLAPLEALATGLPTLVTDWSGMVDFADPADTLIVGHHMTRAYQFDLIYRDHFDKPSNENSGYWAEPNLAEVRTFMRWTYEHREQAKAMGKQAAKRISESWTWDYKVKTQLLPLFEKCL